MENNEMVYCVSSFVVQSIQFRGNKTTMTIEERKQKLVTLGAVIAKELPGFYGNVQFNIQGGKSVYVSITETTKPERQEDV